MSFSGPDKRAFGRWYSRFFMGVAFGLLLGACAPRGTLPVHPMPSPQEVLNTLEDQGRRMNTYRAIGRISPGTVKKFPSVDIVVHFRAPDSIALTGYSPMGLKLFEWHLTEAALRELSLGNGSMMEIFGPEVLQLPLLIETLNFYGRTSDRRETTFLWEADAAYVAFRFQDLPCCEHPKDGVSIPQSAICPAKSWWISKDTMALIRKEIYRTGPCETPRKSFSVEYRDHRWVESERMPGVRLQIPFVTILKDGSGQEIAEFTFREVHLNDEDSGS